MIISEVGEIKQRELVPNEMWDETCLKMCQIKNNDCLLPLIMLTKSIRKGKKLRAIFVNCFSVHWTTMWDNTSKHSTEISNRMVSDSRKAYKSLDVLWRRKCCLTNSDEIFCYRKFHWYLSAIFIKHNINNGDKFHCFVLIQSACNTSMLIAAQFQLNTGWKWFFFST